MSEKISTYDELRVVGEQAELNLTQDQRDARMLLKLDKLEGMRGGAHTRIRVSFAGTEFSLRLITAQERVEATELALAEHYKKPEVIRWKPNLDLLMQVHILYFALTPCPQQANDAYAQLKVKEIWYMTENQIHQLYQTWVEFDKEYNPDVDNMTEEEFSILLEDVKKKPELLFNASYRQLLRMNMYYTLREQVATPKAN